MRDITFTDVGWLAAVETDVAFQMDEETFRGFYERTARSVWACLSRLTGDAQLADDLLQETYYRFLRAHRSFDNEAHRRNYPYRIATNQVRDGRRRHRLEFLPVSDEGSTREPASAGDLAEQTALRTDLRRALAERSASSR